ERDQGRRVPLAALPANDLLALGQGQARPRPRFTHFTAEGTGVAAREVTLDRQLSHGVVSASRGLIASQVLHRPGSRKNSLVRGLRERRGGIFGSVSLQA